MGSPIISFREVSKTFGLVKALDSVSFQIGKGEFVFIVGPSGSGKTTILRLLLREIVPSSGQILFEEKDISLIKKEEVAVYRQRIGVVFQDFRLIAERTVAENIETVLAIKGIKEDEWAGRVDQCLKLVGLADRQDTFPQQLSGGEIQRVSLARALAMDPEVIFADEPTGNLDWETGEAIMALLAKINKGGKTIIITSHNKAIIDKMKKRVITLKNGKIVKNV